MPIEYTTEAQVLSLINSAQAGNIASTFSDLKKTPNITNVSKLNSNPSKYWAGGIDSLTYGAGGSTIRNFFTPKWWQSFGSSEIGFVPLAFENTTDLGLTFGKTSDVTYMDTASDYSIDPIKYSLNGKGLYVSSGVGTGNFSIGTGTKKFTKARLYYLTKPSGGTFTISFSSTSAALAVDVDCDDTLGISYYDLDKSDADSSTVLIREITGDCAFFAIHFFNGESASEINLAKGGMTLRKISGLDSDFRQSWYSLLTPSVLLFNAGTNDRSTITPAQFETDLGNYIDDVQAGSPNTRIIIVEPNRTSDYDSTYAIDYYGVRQSIAVSRNCEFLDIPKFIGDYNYFVTNSMMEDSVHPNAKGNELIARMYVNFLGLGNFGKSVEIEQFDGGSGGADPVITGPIQNYYLEINVASTEYTAYSFGLINGSPVIYFDLIVYVRQASSGNTRIKRIRFTVTNTNTTNAATNVGTLSSSDDYVTGPVIADLAFTISIVSGKAVLKYTPDNSCQVSIVGIWRAWKELSGTVVYYN